MSLPFAASPLDAWRGANKTPTKDEIEAAERRYWAVMAKAQAPKVCPCHPPGVTDVTRYSFSKTSSGQTINNPESLTPAPPKVSKNE